MGLNHTGSSGVDDAAFGVALQTVAPAGALADETATDSVNEGDVGVVRMTLDRRLIDASHTKDDTSAAVGTAYAAGIGAMADDTSPDSVDEGDLGLLRMSLARALHVVNVADVATLTNVASLATSATICAANANRIGLLVFNDDANTLFLKYGATASATSYTVKIAGGGYWEMPSPIYRGVLDGIWDVDGSGSARVTELT